MAKNESGGRRFGALDAFVILLLAVAVIGVASRYLLTDENGILASSHESVEVAVAVLIQDLPYTSSGVFTEGAIYYLSDGEAQLSEGTVISDFTETPAEYYTENENGELELSYASGDYANIDCRGLLRVTGYYKDGVFMIGEGESAAPLVAGMYVTVVNGTVSESALVTDITPIS